MGTKIHRAPTPVHQTYTDTCWAAVIQAFCSVAIGRPKVTEEQIIREYDSYCHKDGTLTLKGLWAILGDIRFGLSRNYVSSKNFTSDYLYQKLCSGYVVIGYHEIAINGKHVGLIYGIDDDSVYYMNPDAGVTGGNKTMSINHFTGSGSDLIVGGQKW
jgi:hypothetical protein